MKPPILVASLALALAIVLPALSGCCKPVWVERRIPTTDAERKAVAEQVEHILAATPRTLSGHDQDWDDAIRAAQSSAEDTHVRLTYWERVPYGWPPNWEYSGRWRYAEKSVSP
jgi:hypothetical protein